MSQETKTYFHRSYCWALICLFKQRTLKAYSHEINGFAGICTHFGRSFLSRSILIESCWLPTHHPPPVNTLDIPGQLEETNTTEIDTDWFLINTNNFTIIHENSYTTFWFLRHNFVALMCIPWLNSIYLEIFFRGFLRDW